MKNNKILAGALVATLAITGMSSTASASMLASADTKATATATTASVETKALKKFSTTKKIADYYSVDVSDVKNYGKGFFMIESEGFLKFNGKTFNGVYKNKMYKSGRLASGEIKGITYYEGKVVNNDVFLGDFYKNGKLFTGAYKNYHYTKGEPSTGLIVDNGVTYREGYVAYGLVDGKYYEKGKIFSGIGVNGNYYVDGERATGFVDGVKYVYGYPASGYGYGEDGKTLHYFEDGLPFTGTSYDGVKFVDGVEFTGFEGSGTANSGKVYDVYYEKGVIFTGFAVPKGSTTGEKVEMLNGVVKDGDYDYHGSTIRFVEGKFKGFVGADGNIDASTAPAE